MKLKPGVRLVDLTPQMVLAAIIIEPIYTARGTICTITSANDSSHSAKSLHYTGKALDFRTHDYSGNKTALATDIKLALGTDFDVILEASGEPNEHIHVEYDPKGVV